MASLIMSSSLQNPFSMTTTTTIKTVLLVLTLSMISHDLRHNGVEGKQLSTDPTHLAVEVGQEASIKCTKAKKGGGNGGEEVVHIVWKQQDQVVANKSTTTNTADDVTLTLTITNATKHDSGIYTCQLVKKGNNSNPLSSPSSSSAAPDANNADVLLESETMRLVVYVMPHYTTELVVLGVICLGLSIIILSNLAYGWNKKRKELAKDNMLMSKSKLSDNSKEMMVVVTDNAETGERDVSF